MGYIKRTEKYSYSKINTYLSCPFKYYLTYVLGHFIDTSNINTYFGSLVHKIEERIGIALKNHETINYEELKNDFLNYNITKPSKFSTGGELFGINILKNRFSEEYYKPDNNGRSFATKAQEYLDHGIYRLENYMKEHPNLEIVSTEQHFEVEFHGVTLVGSIDRVLRDKSTGEYIIEDIKTKDKLFSEKDCVTPLQAVIYSYALKSIKDLKEYPTKFRYDLPICGQRQEAGTPGYIDRGIKKIAQTLEEIKSFNIYSKDTPLCYWCPFSKTNPYQPEEAKHLCFYYSKWTPENRVHTKNKVWKDLECYQKDLQEEIQVAPVVDNSEFDF